MAPGSGSPKVLSCRRQCCTERQSTTSRTNFRYDVGAAIGTFYRWLRDPQRPRMSKCSGRRCAECVVSFIRVERAGNMSQNAVRANCYHCLPHSERHRKCGIHDTSTTRGKITGEQIAQIARRTQTYMWVGPHRWRRPGSGLMVSPVKNLRDRAGTAKHPGTAQGSSTSERMDLSGDTRHTDRTAGAGSANVTNCPQPCVPALGPGT